MKSFQHVIAHAWPLGLILLLLSGTQDLQHAAAPASPPDLTPQSDRPSRVTHSVPWTPVALLPSVPRLPFAGESRTQGPEYEPPSEGGSSPASTASRFHVSSQRFASEAGMRGLLELTCPLLCVFLC